MRFPIRWLAPVALAAAAACFATSCSPSDEAVFFPVSRSGDAPDALVGGLLARRNGCLFAAYPGGEELLIIWPSGYRFEDPGVVNESDQIVASLGEQFSGGGGLVEEEVARRLIGRDIPSPCRTMDYMLVGELYEPSPGQ